MGRWRRTLAGPLETAAATRVMASPSVPCADRDGGQEPRRGVLAAGGGKGVGKTTWGRRSVKPRSSEQGEGEAEDCHHQRKPRVGRGAAAHVCYQGDG